MKIKNRELLLTRRELKNMIMYDNPDTFDGSWSKIPLLNIIDNYENFSIKQYKWILSKVNYIINHNDKYKNYRKKFSDFNLDD